MFLYHRFLGDILEKGQGDPLVLVPVPCPYHVPVLDQHILHIKTPRLPTGLRRPFPTLCPSRNQRLPLSLVSHNKSGQPFDQRLLTFVGSIAPISTLFQSPPFPISNVSEFILNKKPTTVRFTKLNLLSRPLLLLQGR